MDFSYTPEQEAFRMEVRHWLADHLPPELCIDDPADERVAPNREIFEKRRAWQAEMYAAGWVGIAWPREFGGRGASVLEQVIFNEEYGRARAPMLPGYSGIGMCGPTIAQSGTPEQRQRFLKHILSGQDIWCQGYSEPNAGSDLAGIQTRAEDKGDYFVLNGQKIWTSVAQYADWMFLLARSDPAAPKHLGISYLLLDMRTKGVEVRPLVTASGHAHFNEVFFEDVHIPKENLVGRKNEGWKVAMTTLSYERGAAGGGYDSQIRGLVDLAHRYHIDGRPAWEHDWVRQRIANLAIESKAARYARLRSLTRQLKGQPPGPEGSMLKLFGSELGMRIAFFASEMLGPYAQVAQPMPALADAARWQNRVISSRQYTIAGGTSEIQRNIIGERTLRLPKG
ncbi:MAG TPA: acyl-CoA dehydrogenase [Candidatus Binataceae bacterium]|nr:acyl-CoA dehydrogenase [Candidatus Binataceae bacterium]